MENQVPDGVDEGAPRNQAVNRELDKDIREHDPEHDAECRTRRVPQPPTGGFSSVIRSGALTRLGSANVSHGHSPAGSQDNRATASWL
jgi:hypothetical protein